MNVVLRKFGSLLAKYLAKARPYYERFSVISQVQLISNLQPGDVLLVEVNSRVSTAIKIPHSINLVPCQPLCGGRYTGRS